MRMNGAQSYDGEKIQFKCEPEISLKKRGRKEMAQRDEAKLKQHHVNHVR